MWYECECALDLVLDPFLTNFRAIWRPQTAPKMVRKSTVFGSIFKPLFYQVLKLFKCLLGAFLSLLCSSWEPPRREKYCFLTVKWHFLKMIPFGALKLLMALLGPSWLLLGPIWFQKGPKNGPRNYPKVVQKMIQKTAPPTTHSKTILGSKNLQTK